MNKQQISGLIFLALFSASASADTMYQCVDADGHRSFSNIKLSGPGVKCTPMDLGPVPSSSTQPSSNPPKTGTGSRKVNTPSPSGFPKVDTGAQKTRDNDRRRILESELEVERKNLEQAKKNLAEQDEVRLGNEQNYQKKLDRLQPFKDKVAQHERNIEALSLEISKLK